MHGILLRTLKEIKTAPALMPGQFSAVKEAEKKPEGCRRCEGEVAEGIPQRRKASWWGAGEAGKEDEQAPHKEEKRVGGVPQDRRRSGIEHPTRQKRGLKGAEGVKVETKEASNIGESKCVGCRRSRQRK